MNDELAEQCRVIELARQAIEIARRAYQEADEVWSAELRHAFGDDGGDLRHTPAGEGDPNTPLRFAFERYRRARERWHLCINEAMKIA